MSEKSIRYVNYVIFLFLNLPLIIRFISRETDQARWNSRHALHEKTLNK